MLRGSTLVAVAACMLGAALPLTVGMQVSLRPGTQLPTDGLVMKAVETLDAAKHQIKHLASEVWHTVSSERRSVGQAVGSDVVEELRVVKHAQIANQTLTPFFVDVSRYAFPQEWFAWNHVGFPRRYACTPAFPDLNGDGVLDFFYHNHYEQFPEKDWDLGISYGTNLPQEGGQPFFSNATSEYIVSTEVPNTDYTRIPSDMHSAAFLDIDRDGLLDIYISTGGGMGMDHGKAKNALLLWGEPSDHVKQKFRGGRNIVEDANMANLDSRGRFTYFADFNKDGLLDLIFSNDVRVDADNRYGYAMFNRGNRSFEPRFELSEYSGTMILHDADGDGRAEEMVIQRARCLPDAGSDGTPAAEPTEEILQFCDPRPEGSTAVYKYEPTEGRMKLVSPRLSAKEDEDMWKDKEMGRSMQSGDFDGDGRADLLILHVGSVDFHLSSRREPGVLPIGAPDARIQWNISECLGRSMRTGDLNLDGLTDIIVMCSQPGAHRFYTRGWNGNWLMREALGDIHSLDLARLHVDLLPEACGENFAQERPVYLNEWCSSWADGLTHKPAFTTYGLGLVDWDNDGYLDIVVTHDVGRLMMLRNNWATIKGQRRYLALKLVGRESNAYGIGATVLLQSRQMGFENKSIVQLREIYSASHDTDWWGSRDDRIIFGLGRHGVPESLTVRWPGKSAYVQVFDNSSFLLEYCNSMKNLLVVEEPEPAA